MTMKQNNVKPADGRLGVLCVGLGDVSSTFMAGVLMIRKIPLSEPTATSLPPGDAATVVKTSHPKVKDCVIPKNGLNVQK